MSQPSELITSKQNALIKRMRALGHREARIAEGMVVVEGLRAIIEVVHAQVSVETLLVAPERIRSELARQTIITARKRGAQYVTATPEVLDSLSERDTSQGIIAIAARPQATLGNIPRKPNQLIMALYEPQDPGNIGTIARTADGAGATALVIFGKKYADPFDPKSIRASMGSVFTLPIIELGPTATALAAMQTRDLHLIGAAGASGTVELWDVPLRGSVAIVLGNERAGLPPEVLDACHTVANVPMLGHADSLNLAAAAAIFAYEAVRQRRSGH